MQQGDLNVEVMLPFIDWVNRQSSELRARVLACMLLVRQVMCTPLAVGAEAEWVMVPNYWSAIAAFRWIQQLAMQAEFLEAAAYCQAKVGECEQATAWVLARLQELPTTLEMGYE